jgi:hypothetical protein
VIVGAEDVLDDGGPFADSPEGATAGEAGE